MEQAMQPSIWKLNTSNQGKFVEFQRLFAAYGCTLVATHHDLPEIAADPVSVVVHKAGQLGERTLVEDTSLEVEGADVGINVRWLLTHLDEFIGRKALWRVLLAYCQNGQIHVYQGEVHGALVPPRGEKGFGFDPFFLPDGASHTLAENKFDQYNARALAVAALMQGKALAVRPFIEDWQGLWQ